MVGRWRNFDLEAAIAVRLIFIRHSPGHEDIDPVLEIVLIPVLRVLQDNRRTTPRVSTLLLQVVCFYWWRDFYFSNPEEKG